MAWCYFGSAKLITWYHFFIINAQPLEVFVHIKAKRGWKLFGHVKRSPQAVTSMIKRFLKEYDK